MRLRRFEKCGATFTEDLSSLAYCRQKFTVNSLPVQTTMRGKGAIQFDGSNDYIETNWRMPLTGSVSLWVKVISAEGADVFCGSYSASMNGLFIAIDTRFKFSIGGSSEISVGNVTLGKVYHLVLTWHSGSAKYYINGEHKGNISYSNSPINEEGYFPIGAYHPSSGYSNHSNAVIQDLLVFPFVLTPEDVSALYNGTTFDYEKHLVSEWKMDEPYVKDRGWRGYGNDGEPINIGVSDVIRYGRSKTGIRFDGATQSIRIADDETLRFGEEDFTLAAMFKATSGTSGRILNKEYGNPYYRLMTYPTGALNPRIRDVSGEEAKVFSSADVSDGQKHFASASIDRSGEVMNAAIDGVEDTRIAISPTVGDISNTDPLYIGSERGNTNFFDGIIMDAAIYDAPLCQLAHADLRRRKERGL